MTQDNGPVWLQALLNPHEPDSDGVDTSLVKDHVCLHCQQWAARSHKQLRIRLKNIHFNKAATVFPCPHCEGTAWATTEEFVRGKPPLWDRIWNYVKDRLPSRS
jgi:hypothetical protein